MTVLPTFKNPIEYCPFETLYPMDLSIINDLQYDILFYNLYGTSKSINQYDDDFFQYTTDCKYLSQTQQVIRSAHNFKHNETTVQKFYENRDHIYEPNFNITYGYMHIIPGLQWINYSNIFMLAMMCIMFILPVFTVLSPICAFIIPVVFYLMFGGISSMWEIAGLCKQSNNTGKTISWLTGDLWCANPVFFLLLFASYYAVQCFQSYYQLNRLVGNNCRACQMMGDFVQFAEESIYNIELFATMHKTKSAYSNFISDATAHLSNLNKIKNMRQSGRLYDIGSVLSNLYELVNNRSFNFRETLEYAIKFNQYIYKIKCLSNLVETNQVRFAQFIGISDKITNNKGEKDDNDESSSVSSSNNGDDDENDNVMINMRYPLYSGDGVCVPNNVSLNNNIIITGPNASGKTTIMKGMMLNQLLTQQYGLGYYDSYNVHPHSLFNKFHSYVNIPDTFARDSLFQAEARRCRDILTSIECGDKEDRHLCIFDELFSGTCPTDATQIGIVYLKHIVKQYSHQIVFQLTTHFHDICKELEGTNKTRNMNMDVNCTETTMCPTYKLCDGITAKKGAVYILRDMKFPEEIINALVERVSNNK